MTEAVSRPVIVIPAYNEAATIEPIVRRLSQAAPVIVVDDGSVDATARLAAEAGAIVASQPQNAGYDAALERGFAEASRLGYDRVVTLDADGEHDPELAQAFLSALDEAPLALGRRPRKQRLAERVFGLYVYLRYGVHDILCGMKGYHMRLYEANGGFDHCGSVGTELAIFALSRGCEFREIAVAGRPRIGRARFGDAWAGNLSILKGMLRLMILSARWPKVKSG